MANKKGARLQVCFHDDHHHQHHHHHHHHLQQNHHHLKQSHHVQHQHQQSGRGSALCEKPNVCQDQAIEECCKKIRDNDEIEAIDDWILLPMDPKVECFFQENFLEKYNNP